MTVLYMEGFDLHSDPIFGGLDVGAGSMQDAGKYWTGGTPLKYTFAPGYLGGRSFNVGASSQQIAGGGVRSNTNSIRIGFWAMGQQNTGQSFVLVQAAQGEQRGYRVWVSSTGQLQLRYKPGAASPEVVLTGFTALSHFGNSWQNYEFFVNTDTGEVRLWVNKILVFNVTYAVPAFQSSVTLGFRQLGANPFRQRYDHLWVTNGPALNPSSDVQAVQVVGAVDKLSSNDGFRGTLVMGGLVHQSAFDTSTIWSGFQGLGLNLANIVNYIFPTNPSTGNEWKNGEVSSIEQWGLCYAAQGTPGFVRLAGMHFTWLDYNNGQPILRNSPVSNVTSFSGTWIKSDPSKTYAALIGAMPRPQIALEANAPSVRTNGGCILFQSPGASVPQPVLGEVGITFAEEFRQDYRDWVRVTGAGSSYESFFDSGYSVLAEGDKQFQDNYITINYDNIPTGACYVQGLWDYAEKSSTGRWSMRQTLENLGGDYRHAHRRLKIRGQGRAMQIRITNKGDNPFKINGWTIAVSSNGAV